MEKVYGATERHDQLLVFVKSNKATLIYGYGEEDGQGYDLRHTFNHIPTKAEVRDILYAHINAETDLAILTGHTFEGRQVWLSSENQFNYKSSYDLAKDKGSLILPITVKLGNDDAPFYRIFETFDEYESFFLGAFAYIQRTLAAGWDRKDEAALWVDSLIILD